jgi:predicted ribosome quality control (RQC) complex YloA/Tae2 family protein
VEPASVEAAVAEARARGESAVRGVLAACPGLGPRLARAFDGTAPGFRGLRDALAAGRPTLRAPGAPGDWRDASLAPSDAVVLAPIDVGGPGVLLHPSSWEEAAASFLVARLRGGAFAERQRAALDEVRRRARRLGQLEHHLAADLAGLPDEAELRRQGEALLASPGRVPPGAASAEVADPWDAERRLVIALDPRLSAPANADRLFEKARRIERSRRQVAGRLQETRSAQAAARAREEAVLEAGGLDELEPPEGRAGTQGDRGRGPLGFLTTRGLSVLVGRGAAENHRLTFTVARPEDLWLHARDVPGGHVVLRDPEGRAGADDIREAAELAAFFSEARRESAVDVHVTRRKHVRPARGGPGRVFVHHSDTVRVSPRDPEGRLRVRR